MKEKVDRSQSKVKANRTIRVHIFIMWKINELEENARSLEERIEILEDELDRLKKQNSASTYGENRHTQELIDAEPSESEHRHHRK